MTNETQKNGLRAMSVPAARAANRTMQIIKVGIFAISLAAAIPTARNLYYSWQDGIPFSEVSHRLDQYDLWMKNLECNVKYRTLSTTAGTRVDVGTCPQSGDIAIKVSAPSAQAQYEWIAYDKLPKPSSKSAGLWDLLMTPAHAEGAATPSQSTSRSNDERIIVAQAAVETVCQARSGKDKIVRVIKDGDKCFKEIVSPMKGTVENRSEVPCNTQCR